MDSGICKSNGGKYQLCLFAPARVGFCIFLIRVSFCQGGAVSPDAPNYRTPKENATDRHLELERDCVEITVMSCRPMSSGLGLFLIRVRIYQVVLFSYHIEL